MLFEAALIPVFVQVGLIFALLIGMGVTRQDAVRNGGIRSADIALGQPAWPARPTQFANCFANQFELPVLYFVLVAFALITKKADYLFVIMSWIFVILRIAHAGIHVGSNVVRHRFTVYSIGALVLFLMWVIFALHVLIGP